MIKNLQKKSSNIMVSFSSQDDLLFFFFFFLLSFHDVNFCLLMCIHNSVNFSQQFYFLNYLFNYLNI